MKLVCSTKEDINLSNVLISHDKKEKIVTITLNKLPLNICEQNFYREIKAAFDQVNAMEDDVAVVLLQSACRHFCAGGELEEIQQCSTREKVNEIAGAAAGCMGAIYSCRYPVVAAVNGNAIGAGCAMAACCDVVIASDTTKFVVPEITAGYIGASEFLEMMIPRRLARYYIFTGAPITAQEMKHWGAVLDVVPQERLSDRAIEVAKQIAAQSPLALCYFKEAMNHNDDERLAEKYFYEAEYTLKYNGTEDCKETYRAFKEKRKPVFHGR